MTMNSNLEIIPFEEKGARFLYIESQLRKEIKIPFTEPHMEQEIEIEKIRQLYADVENNNMSLNKA